MKVGIGCASWLTLLLVGSSIIVVLPKSSTTVTTTFQQPTIMPSASMSYDKYLKNKLTPFVNFILPITTTTTTTTTSSNINEIEDKTLLPLTTLGDENPSEKLFLTENSIRMTAKTKKTTETTTSILPPSSSSSSSLLLSSLSSELISESSKSSHKIKLNSNKGSNKNRSKTKAHVNSSIIDVTEYHSTEVVSSTTSTTETTNNNFVSKELITSNFIISDVQYDVHNTINKNSINTMESSNHNQQTNHYQHYNQFDHQHLYHKHYQNQQHSNGIRNSNSDSSSSRTNSYNNHNINNNRNNENNNNYNNDYVSSDNINLNNRHNKILSNSISIKSKRNVLQNDDPNDAASKAADLCAKFTEGDTETNTFHSPNFPDNYPKNINCTKVITAPVDHIIRLDFRDVFNIEDKEECKFDYLEVRDGPYGFSKLAGAGRFCGRTFPEEIISTERHLWLYFHSDESIEYEGFTAVYEFVERPKNVPSKDLNCTIIKKGYEGWINDTDVPQYVLDNVTQHKIPIDCMWRIEAPENWRIQTKFILFNLNKPNDCNMNFIDIFPEDTTIPARLKNFCGSAGESAQSSSSILHIRYYAEQDAMKSQFEILYTAYRDKGTSNCHEEYEYDCEDTTCISSTLKCNGRDNCKFRWDEENCKSDSGGQSEHVVIIIVVFGLILGGMIASFLFNCIRKLVRDQKIIREHIRQSKESKLDEMGRNSVKRSGENLSVKLSPKEKHSQTSLQILDDISNRFYRDMIPLPEIKADPILRQQHDIVAQTNLGPIIDDRESLSSPDRGIGNPASCDMGCQTRESLFSPPSTTTLVRQKSLGTTSSSSPNQSQSAIRFSTFGYDTNNPPMQQHQQQQQLKSKTLARHSTINNRTSAAIEMEELQHHHNTLPHNMHHHHHTQQQQQQQQQPQQQYQIGYSKLPPTQRMSGMQNIDSDIGVPPLPASITSGRGQPEVCHHHHQHKQHLQQQQLQAAQQQQHIGWKLACGGNTTPNTGINSGGGGGNGNINNKQQQGKLDESKVYIDIRKSAPDVIIMTSH